MACSNKNNWGSVWKTIKKMDRDKMASLKIEELEEAIRD